MFQFNNKEIAGCSKPTEKARRLCHLRISNSIIGSFNRFVTLDLMSDHF